MRELSVFFVFCLQIAAIGAECVYTTTAGDSLSAVAQRFNCSGAEPLMAQLNSLSSAQPNNALPVGTPITVPDSCFPLTMRNATEWPASPPCAPSASDCAVNANGTCFPGSCVETLRAFQCVCRAGFRLSATATACGRSGFCTAACEIVPPASACATNRCLSVGATCETSVDAAADQFVCRCAAGQRTVRTNRTVCEPACAGAAACGDAPNVCGSDGVCACAPGYDLVDGACVDQCRLRASPCSGPTATCFAGRCRCTGGFALSVTGDKCVDKCDVGAVQCFGSTSSCRNGVCSCGLGYALRNERDCVDTCSTMTCTGPTASCSAGFCSCGAGHAYAAGACAANTQCNNFKCVGGTCSVSASKPAFCLCPAGFAADASARCVDVDECATGAHTCKANEMCNNRNGTFICTLVPGRPPPAPLPSPTATAARPPATTLAAAAPESGDDQTAVIVGAVMGGLGGIALIAVVVSVLVQRNKRRAAPQPTTPPAQAAAAGGNTVKSFDGSTFKSAASSDDIYKPLTLKDGGQYKDAGGGHYIPMAMRPAEGGGVYAPMTLNQPPPEPDLPPEEMRESFASTYGFVPKKVPP